MSRSYRVQGSSSFTHTMPVFLLAKSLENPICTFDAGKRGEHVSSQRLLCGLLQLVASVSPMVLIFFSPQRFFKAHFLFTWMLVP